MAKNNKKNNNKKEEQVKEPRKKVWDRRLRILTGIIISGFAIMLFLALVSYLFTWKKDQSFLSGHVFSGSEIKVENWSGKAGAYLSDLVMNRGIGIASFCLPILFLLIGLKILKIRIRNLGKTLILTLITSAYISILLGFVFSDFNGVFGSGPGGRHGLYVSDWIVAFIGKPGTTLFLTVFFLGLLFYSHKGLSDRLINYFNQKRIKLNETSKNGTFSGKSILDNAKEKEDMDEAGESDLSENFEVKTISGDDDDDLVFEAEFPQKEQNSDINFKVIEKPVPPEELEMDIQKVIETAIEEPYNVEMEDYDPTLELSHYKLPPIDILEKHDEANSTVTNEELISNKNKIVETLAHYKIQIDKIKATIGPTVTLYEIVPAPGVRISKIKSLEDDIALNLAALGIRIIAPIPGKGTIGIEVPNLKPEIVSMRSILSSRKFQDSEYDLAIAIGKTISNETYVFDLAKMPHLLLAGATGQGKSVGLNAIIASLLYRKHPSQIKFVLIDPKKVELTLYAKLEKHFLAKIPDAEESIITDTQKVIYTLNSLTIEMDKRYELLKLAQVRNLKEYNQKFIKRRLNPEKGHHFLPYIVVIIDEFADLIMTAGREVEIPLARLAQLARAIGIHLVIATQRPTTNIITGVIKANFPARIAFRVTSMIDSRTILDSPGANQLVGRGDMLMAPGSDMIRIQCAFIDIPEIEKITDHISSQQGYPTPFYLPEFVDENAIEIGEVDLSKKDNLFCDAARLIVTHQQGSTSLIQRKFSIGYNRAGRIMDQLEAAGIVGPPEGSKPRQVLFPEITSLEQFLHSLEN